MVLAIIIAMALALPPADGAAIEHQTNIIYRFAPEHFNAVAPHGSKCILSLIVVAAQETLLLASHDCLEALWIVRAGQGIIVRNELPESLQG